MEVALTNLHPTDVAVVDCLGAITGRARHCAKSALRHLERADLIVKLDPEMAIFHALTAEEEAATAVFFAVKHHRYPNANKLKHRDHTHKNALYPFLIAINNYLAGIDPPMLPWKIFTKTEGDRKFLATKIQTPDDRWGEPQPPLGFEIKRLANGTRERFASQLQELAEGAGAADVRKYLGDCANVRNRLLYASDQGVPIARGDVPQTLLTARARVFVLLRALCLIFPHKERALFVQQVLDAFLLALKAIKEDDIQW